VAQFLPDQIPEGVESFEALAVWAVARLARMARGRTVGAGANGAQVSAVSSTRIEAADGRLYARLEVFLPLLLDRLNDPEQKSWMATGSVVGALDPDTAVEPPPPPPPPPPFDPLSLSPADLWDLTKEQRVTVSGGLILSVANRVQGRAALSSYQSNEQPEWVAAAGAAASYASWGTAANTRHLSSTDEGGSVGQVAEMWIVARCDVPAEVFPDYIGLLNPLSLYVEPWLTANSGSESFYAFAGGAYIHANGDESQNIKDNMFPTIKSWAALRIGRVTGKWGRTGGITVGMDRSYLNYSRGWRGGVRFVGLWHEPVPEASRPALWQYLNGLRG